MNSDRSAASVTLDTIIAAAVLPFVGPHELTPEFAARQAAQAVTDALLAKGATAVTRDTRLYPDDGTYSGQRILVIPLEAS